MNLKKTIMTDDHSPSGSYYKRVQMINIILGATSFIIILLLIGEIGLYSMSVCVVQLSFLVWSYYDHKRGFAIYLQERYG